MRPTLAVLLAALISPLAHAELLDEINDRGELRVAVQTEQAPYAFDAGEHLDGFNVELGQALAKELDVRATVLPTRAEERLPGVESGLYDIALTPRAVPPQAPVDTSQPYSTQAWVIAFQKDNPAFASAVNNALQRLTDSGRVAELERKWLTSEHDPEQAAALR